MFRQDTNITEAFFSLVLQLLYISIIYNILQN